MQENNLTVTSEPSDLKMSPKKSFLNSRHKKALKSLISVLVLKWKIKNKK